MTVVLVIDNEKLEKDIIGGLTKSVKVIKVPKSPGIESQHRLNENE